MNSGSERHVPGESVFESNLRALLSRCYRPAAAEPAFRARARAACLAALVKPTRPALDARSADDDRRALRGARGQRIAWPRAAAAVAALLLVAVSALLWWVAEARGDDRRDAILARGEVAARSGPSGRWQAFGLDEGDGPDDRDVAHAALASGELHVVTPAALGLDVELPDLPAATGACIEPASRVRLERSTALQAELEQGGLSLTCASSAPSWTLATPQGALELTDGSLSAHILGAKDGGPGGAVWLLLDGSATLRGASGARPLPSGRALSLRLGAITAFTEADGDAHLPAGAGTAFVPPSAERRPEPLAAAASVDGPGSASTDAPPKADVAAARVLQGSVRKDGAPVPSFRLVLVPQDVPPRAEVQSRDVSAVEGRFRWDDVAPGSYVLFVLAPAAAAWKRSGVEVTATGPLEPLTVELDAQGATLSGFVTDRATGEPLAGAVVLSETDAPARLLPLDGSPMPELVTALAVTDERGHFQLERLSAGQQLLRATTRGHAPDWSGLLSVQPGEHADGLLFRLAPEARVRGHVVGADGAPSVGAILIASPQPETLRPCVSYSTAITGDDGSYVLGSQPAGAGIVILLGDDDARAAGTPSRIQAASLVPGTDAVIDFTLPPVDAEAAAAQPAGAAAPPGCHLRGRLFGPDGAAAPQVMVSVVREDASDAEASQQWLGSMTAPDGSFEFVGLSPGAWELFIGDGDGTSICRARVLDVPAASELEVDVNLPGGALAGQATSADSGQPVPRALVVLMRRDAPDSPWAFHGRQLADPSGRFRFEHMAAGRYQFMLHDLDGVLAASSSPEVLLTADDELEGLDVALPFGSALLVRVRDARGAPVAEALVSLSDAAGELWQFAASMHTGAEGGLRVAGMPPGRWRVAVSGPPEAGLAPREVAVELRVGMQEDLEIVLPDAR